MFNYKLSRRAFLAVAGGMTAASVLAACAPKATPAPEEQPAKEAEQPAASAATATPASAAAPAGETGVTFSYWVGWPNHGDIFEGFMATEEFKTMLGPNKIEFQDGIKADVLLSNIAAGTPPSVWCGSAYIDIMSRGVARPIADLVETSELVNPEDFIPSAWERCSYQGVQYGVPANECFLEFGLNYNTNLVGEAGLDPDNPPVTWDELFEWHKALTKFDANGNLMRIGIDPYDAVAGGFSSSIGFMMGASWGVKGFDEQTRTFHLDAPEIAEAFETLGEFIKLIGPDNLVGMRSVEGQGTWGGAYSAGVQAMIIEGYWHPGETAKDSPDISKYNRATWLPVPEARRGKLVQCAGGHMCVLFKEGQNTDVAFMVPEFLQTKPALDVLFNTNGWLPSRPSYLETVDPSVYPGLDFYFRSYEEANDWHIPPRCEIEAFVSTKYQELRENVFRGTMTGAEAAEAWQKAAEEEWANAGWA
ncbi:MAG: extracellular solute-binding protein [Anaerolineales bacterium]